MRSIQEIKNEIHEFLKGWEEYDSSIVERDSLGGQHIKVRISEYSPRIIKYLYGTKHEYRISTYHTLINKT